MSEPRRHASMSGRELLAVARLFLARARGRAILALLLLLLGSLTEGASLLLLVPMLQLVQDQGDGWTIVLPVDEWFSLSGGPIEVGLAQMLAAFCGLIILLALITRTKNILLSRVLQSVVNELRLNLFDGVSNARWQFVATMRSADINHLLTADIDRIQSAAFNFLMLVQSAILIVVYGCVSWIISPPMTIFAALSGLTILLLLQPVRKLASRYGRELSEQRQNQYRIVTEFLSGMKVAKSFNAEQQYVDGLATTLDRSQKDLTRFVRASSTGALLMQVANILALAVFIYFAVEMFQLPMTSLVVLVLLYMRLSPRFTVLQSSLQEVLVNAPALQAIMKLQAECDQNREPPAPNGAAILLDSDVRFEAVSFRHRDAQGQGGVDGASFAVRARSITALLGPSGAGKSTIADLLLGLLTPDSGVISIDGVTLTPENRRHWRDSVAYVPQETFLLHDTIEANVRLGWMGAGMDDIWAALRAANAEAFVLALPEGLSTVVGDRGGWLSGGERQRIALARALLRRPKLLVLDEATNALDWENQELINQSIRALRSEMAVVVIAHHPGLVEFADYIVAVEAGSVIEAGPSELLRQNPSSQLSRFSRTARPA